MEDAIEIEGCARVDYSTIPNQISDVRRHFTNTVHNAQEDGNMLVSRFISNKYHAAKECDGLALNFIDENAADLFPRNVSARCKNDFFIYSNNN